LQKKGEVPKKHLQKDQEMKENKNSFAGKNDKSRGSK
jgi:hypothetical protein